MKIRKFTALNIGDAVKQIKEEMGADAVILSTKNIVNGNGVFGIFNRPLVEVTAATDNDDIKKIPKNRFSTGLKRTSPIESANEEIKNELSELKNIVNKMYLGMNKVSLNSGLNDTFDQEDINDMYISLLAKESKFFDNNIHKNLTKLHKMMIDNGINESLAFQLISSVNKNISTDVINNFDDTKSYMKNILKKLIKDRFKVFDTEGKSIIALIGPTGTGKTTTIAKLAADFSLKQGKSVGLITIDTYRIAAYEQLKTYADIIGVPLKVALTKDELMKSINSFYEKDVVLIDTAGRSHRNGEQMDDLVSLFNGDMKIEKHLVISTNTEESSTRDIINRFSHLSLDSLLFTKVDECIKFGNILNSTIKFNLPLSYITTGQNVPDDIEAATNNRIVNMVFNPF